MKGDYRFPTTYMIRMKCLQHDKFNLQVFDMESN